jgi:DNA-binding NarL/FixJ family response regulator
MQVVLVTSQPVFTLGFKALVESATDLRLAGEATDARSGFQLVDLHKPDVLVMDVSLPGMNGIHAIPEVRRRSSRTRVLLVADWARERDVLEALAAGAHGFASKNDDLQELLGAIRAVYRGQSYVAPAFHNFPALEPGRLKRQLAAPSPDVLKILSPREREVLDLIVRGWRNRAIARELCVSAKTVETHRTRINRKLGCKGASELIRFAAENDLIRRPPRDQSNRPERILLLMMDDDPQVRAQICQELVSEGARQIRASEASQAVAELHSDQSASLLFMDADSDQPVAEIYRHLLSDDPFLARTPVVALFENQSKKPAVRAAVSLPRVPLHDQMFAAGPISADSGARAACLSP